MLALDGQAVRWYWYTFEFESVIDWYTMHDGTIVIVLSPNTFTAMAMTHDSALMLAWLEYLVSVWVWTNRQYVSMGACFKLHWSWLRIRCTMTPSPLHIHSPATQIHCNDNDKRFCSNIAVTWIYVTVPCLLWMNRKCVGIGTCLNFNVWLLSIRCTMTRT